MADDTNFRSHRPADQRWPAQPAPAAGGRDGGNDPLAELARLIGQNDPFGEIAPRPGAPARQAPPVQPPQPTLSSSDPYGAPLSGQPFSAKPFESHGGFPEPRQDSFQPAYDPAIYGTPPQPQAPSYPSQAYYGDPSRIPQAEERFEEDFGDQERPRRGRKLVMVLAGLAIIGTGTAFGYRALYGSGPSGPPPVIKANTSPSKIAATPPGESNKTIYDRVGDASQGEKVVPREEKPVEVKDSSRPAPRVVFPGMPTTPSGSQDSTTMAMTSPPLSTESVGPASAEPKKIRTVTIRPDQTGNAAPASRPAAAPAPAPARAAASAPATTAATSPATGGNAPLSLSPQVASAESSARAAFPTPPPAQRAAPAPAPARVAAVPPAAEVAAGSYTVQISSQRSENEAQSSFRSLQAKFPSILGDRQPIIRRADLGDKGIYFRAMVGPFSSADQATQFCGSLKSAGGQCVVQRN